MRATCCNLKSYVKEVQGVTTKLAGMWQNPLTQVMKEGYCTRFSGCRISRSLEVHDHPLPRDQIRGFDILDTRYVSRYSES
jgi:hypothetical protein